MYKVIKKTYNNMKVDKYICQNENGDIEEFNFNQLLNLIASDNVSNAHNILSDDNDIIIWTDDDIDEQEQKCKYTIVDKIKDGENIVGFKVQDNDTQKVLNLSHKKVWELAANRLVESCEAKMNNEEKIIII